MAQTGLLTTFKPESYLPKFAYFPLYFKPIQETYTLDQLQLELDNAGRASVIRLVDIDGNRLLPFIDISKYDSETKDWFIYYNVERLPYRVTQGSAFNLYPSDLGTVQDFSVTETVFNTTTKEIQLSCSGVGHPSLTFIKYAPIILTVENELYNDLTDYSTITAAPDRLAPLSSTKEFYYDFEERLYTNQNLAGINPANIKIIFSRVGDNNVTLKCSVSSNSGNKPKQTPVVNDYILKLKGQYLRG